MLRQRTTGVDKAGSCVADDQRTTTCRLCVFEMGR